MLTIGRCSTGEIDDVVRFIGQHWKPGHILTTCRPVLDWQYRDEDGQGYAFILARRSSDQSLLGILGYIETKRFDASNDGANVIWLTTWKVRDDAGVSGLGIQLLQYLTQIQPHQAIGAIGLTPSTLPLYRAFGYTVGELQHYVRPNPSTEGFELASISFRSSPLQPAAKGFGPTRLITDDDFNHVALSPPAASVPLKSAEYFRRRYAHHPVYRYVVEAVRGPGAALGLLAARIVEHSGRRALRIVDFSGSIEALGTIGWRIDRLLEEFHAEYADVYNAGIPEEIFAQAGFSRVDPSGPDIVPDHFEPFERRNVRLWYAMKGAEAPVLFKGDGDQDRPNRV
jgi:hypothetical protein